MTQSLRWLLETTAYMPFMGGLLRAIARIVPPATGAGVTSFNTRVGDVTLTAADVTAAGGAPILSPAFTGTPTAPTAAPATNTTQLATTAYVKSQGYAPLASPAFTGVPTAPTPPTADNTTEIATTAFVKAQNYQVIPPGAEYNLAQHGADITGVTDCSALLNSALAAGNNVYAPAGTYRLNFGVTVGLTTKQLYLRGDGLQTTFIIDQAFDPTQTNGVFTLQGREQFAPTMRDFWISFAQPSDVTSRSTFRTLAAGGTSVTGGTGVQYAPAIYYGQANRFKLARLRISNCWDGIFQGSSPSHSGGWWIEDIEISPYHVGLSITDNLDFSHIKGWHHWAFGMVGQQPNIQADGSGYAWQIGYPTGSSTQGINMTDINVFAGRTLIDGTDTWVHAANLMLDGGATLEINNSNWVEIVNTYFTPGGPQSAAGVASIVMAGGVLSLTNFNASTPGSPNVFLNQTGGRAYISNGRMVNAATSTSQQFITQSGGNLAIRGVEFDLPGVPSPYTLAPIHVTGSGSRIFFVGNYVAPYGVGTMGFLQIDTDNANNVVVGNGFATTGYFLPPGPQGNYDVHRGPQEFSFGNQPKLEASWGGTPGTPVNIAQVQADGTVHVAGNAIGLVNDSPAFINGGTYCDNTAHIYANPASGSNVQLIANTLTHALQPSVTLATLTVTMPVAPQQNQMLRLTAVTFGITALTIAPAAGQTMYGTVGTLNPGNAVLYVYLGSGWYLLNSPAAGYLPLIGGALSGGLSFGSTYAANATDLSRHISLYGTNYGLNVISGSMNIDVPSGSLVSMNVGGTAYLAVGSSGVTAGTIVQPVLDNVYTLGTSGNRWSNFYSVIGTFTGTVTAPNINVGTGTGSPNLAVNGAAGQSRILSYQSGGSSRWWLYTSGSTESGANVGSDLAFRPYSDAGAALAVAMLITRSTGVVTVGAGINPTTTNTIPCGASGALWTAVWATNGTIQTSDVRLKTDVQGLPECLGIVDAIEPIRFRWKDGEDKRVHWGFDAQAVRDAVGRDFGGVVDPADDGEEGPVGMASHQMIPILWQAVKELRAEVRELKGRA
jgi:hypothetical protein